MLQLKSSGSWSRSFVVDFGRPSSFPDPSAGVNLLHMRHAFPRSKLRWGVVSAGLLRMCRGPASVGVCGVGSFLGARSKGRAIHAAAMGSFTRSLCLRRRLKERRVVVAPSRRRGFPCRRVVTSSSLPSSFLRPYSTYLHVNRPLYARACSAVSPPSVLLIGCPQRPVGSL